MAEAAGQPPNIVFCQACGARMALDRSLVGRKARCRKCGRVFVVPDTSSGVQTGATRSPALPGARRTGSPPRANAPAAIPENAAPRRDSPAPHGPDLASLEDDKPAGILDELAEAEGTARMDLAGGSAIIDAPTLVAPPSQPMPSSRPPQPEGAFLVMQGLVALGALSMLLILSVRYLGPFLTAYFLLPIGVVFGRRITRRLLHMVSAGKLCVP